ncbi:MAG: ATP-binding cassette domain-containing protein, partial [Anaerolineae bacterium]|nr:ATP-binding cassette domain-containing protein [Anaerolineae bacterium]
MDTPNTTPIIVDAKDLTKSFGDVDVVRDVDFELTRGQILGFIGPSGCGKTTTVRMLAGIYQPT